MLLDDLADQSGVARRKVRIVLTLLKRHGLVREYRGGSWERVQDRLTSVDLSADLTDYEARRLQDHAKLRAMINYCQSAHCRMRYVLEYFGEPIPPDVLDQCATHASRADLVIVAGTSATVYPAAGFALEVKEHGGKLIEVNLYESEITQLCDVSLRGGTAAVLPRLVKAAAKRRHASLS